MITVKFCENQLGYIKQIMQEIQEELKTTEHDSRKAYLEQEIREGENELIYWQKYLDYVKNHGEASVFIYRDTNEIAGG